MYSILFKYTYMKLSNSSCILINWAAKVQVCVCVCVSLMVKLIIFLYPSLSTQSQPDLFWVSLQNAFLSLALLTFSPSYSYRLTPGLVKTATTNTDRVFALNRRRNASLFLFSLFLWSCGIKKCNKTSKCHSTQPWTWDVRYTKLEIHIHVYM